jgi:hypothetical protein
MGAPGRGEYKMSPAIEPQARIVTSLLAKIAIAGGSFGRFPVPYESHLVEFS